MINIKNIKVSFALLNKGIGIAGVVLINTFSPVNVLAQQPNCLNYWTNPNTGENECFSSNLTVIVEPIPLTYNSASSNRYIVGDRYVINFA